MLVLTIILGLLNICLGFALATYLGHGPDGILDVLNIFGPSRSEPEAEQEVESSQTDLNETATVIKQSPPESQEPPPGIPQSPQYSDEGTMPEEMESELVCNDVS